MNVGRYAVQLGSGGGLPVFTGPVTQRGYGIGGALKGVFRAALPFIKQGMRLIGEQALSSGTDLLGDIVAGKNIRTASRRRGKEAGFALAKRAQKGRGKRVIKRSSTSRTVIHTKDFKKKGRKRSWTFGKKGLKIPVRLTTSDLDNYATP